MLKKNWLNALHGFDHQALTETVDGLCAEYPFLQYRYLGTSILGRGIPLLSLGSGKRAVLYVGAHHGMEWITSILLCHFTDDLCQAYKKGTAICRISVNALLQAYTVFIIPMLNPDGVEYQIHGVNEDHPLYDRLLTMNGGSTDFSHWQANARGVDLNHNYNAGFWEYKILEKEHVIPCGAPTRYSGEAPESEPETAALCNFIRFHTSLCGVMTLHTQGEEIFYQSAGGCPKKTEQVAKKLAEISGYRLSTADGLASYGGLSDWCLQKAGLSSFTIECGKGTNPLPLQDHFMIYSTLKKALFAFPSLL